MWKAPPLNRNAHVPFRVIGNYLNNPNIKVSFVHVCITPCGPLLLTSVFDGRLVKSAEITSSSCYHTTVPSLSQCFCIRRQERSATILGILNIHRSKHETHAYKEILFYAHTLTRKIPSAYLSNMILRKLSIYHEIFTN